MGRCLLVCLLEFWPRLLWLLSGVTNQRPVIGISQKKEVAPCLRHHPILSETAATHPSPLTTLTTTRSRTTTMSSAVRTTTTRALRSLRPTASAAIQARNSSSDAADTYNSPFVGASAHRTTKIPDFSKYRSSTSTRGNQVFGYFMVGTMGALSAAGAKATVQGRWMCCWGLCGKGGVEGERGDVMELYPILQPILSLFHLEIRDRMRSIAQRMDG